MQFHLNLSITLNVKKDNSNDKNHFYMSKHIQTNIKKRGTDQAYIYNNAKYKIVMQEFKNQFI
jgi:hypothetical protein